MHLDTAGHAISPALVDEGGLPLGVTVGSDFHAVCGRVHPGPGQRVRPAGEPHGLSAASRRVRHDDRDPGHAEHDRRGRGRRSCPAASSRAASGRPGWWRSSSTGRAIGSAGLVNGKATLGYTVPNGHPQNITATYAGDTDDNYLGSATSRIRTDPTMTARVLSTFPKSRAGWYHTAVDIWFKCDPAGSELIIDCPQNVRLRQSGRNQSVSPEHPRHGRRHGGRHDQRHRHRP